MSDLNDYADTSVFFDWTSNIHTQQWASAQAASSDRASADTRAGFTNGTDDYQWDYVLWWSPNYGGIYLPGIATVDVTSVFNLTVNVSPQSQGATYVPQGMAPKEASIKFDCWTPQHMAIWAGLIPKMIPDRAALAKMIDQTTKRIKEIKSWDFFHPTLAIHGIRSVFITSLSGPKIEPCGGKFTIELKCKEVLPIAVIPRGKAAESKADKDFVSTAEPPPSTRLDRMIR